MRSSAASSSGSLLLAAALARMAFASPLLAQTAPKLSRDSIVALVRVSVAVSAARDSTQAQLAKPANKKPELQQQLREQLHAQIEEILHHGGLTPQEYERETMIVSTDADSRRLFDSVMVVVTGAPLPGGVIAAADRPPAVPVPAGPAGVHIGHVVNSFNDTPMMQGLLPTAVAEARIAASHAQLARRNSTNLDAMKLHAGHVIHAIDPTIVTMGPGLGYGLKRAAMGVATHIDLAAKAPGASPNIVMHAGHIATSARNTVARCDQIVALAQQIRSATSVADAAALVNQLVSLTEQLSAGFDKNGDGRVTWEEGEGGLQQAQEHVNMMLAAEKKP